MPLIGNRSVLNKSPGRFINAWVGTLRSEFGKHGMCRNAFEAFDDKSAIPVGHLAPSAWVMPKMAGGMSSINSAGLVVAPTAQAVGGITTTAETTITIKIADADGQLISSGNGTATLSILSNTPLLTASIGGSGSAILTITGDVSQIGAEASISGNSTITILVADATPYPLNDASPLRDGGASFQISGVLNPYAIGQLTGSTVDNGVLTADSISAAVWNAILADFNENGTAGKALATAGAGGVDLEALAQAILAAAQVTPIHSNVQSMNGAEVIGDGTEGNSWRGVGVPP